MRKILLAALAAFLVMGLFEYNFSDSEVLMILLYALFLPFAAAHGPAPEAAHEHVIPEDAGGA